MESNLNILIGGLESRELSWQDIGWDSSLLIARCEYLLQSSWIHLLYFINAIVTSVAMLSFKTLET
jgi:hypothetical protein